MPNPFKPSAGSRPPLLVGREHDLDTLSEAFDDGPGAPGLLSRITGQRGTGKTVMLSEAEDLARSRGWVVVSETATTGLVQRLARAVRTHVEELGDGPATRRISGVTIAGVGISTDLPPRRDHTFREDITELTERLLQQQTGLLITVDEIHAVSRDEMLELAATIQHVIREGFPIGFIVAGLPQAVEDLLRAPVATFLRRAEPIQLGAVSVRAVEEALVETFTSTGVALTPDQAHRAAAATRGYPFLIQLVGYHVWRRAVEGHLDDAELELGLEAARRRLGATVIEPALAALSPVDRTFLLRMAEDDGPAKLADVAARMGQSVRYASVYRQRLLAAGVITAPAHGRVDFFLPELRDYLREHIASFVDVEALPAGGQPELES